jgi:hypothetical protein
LWTVFDAGEFTELNIAVRVISAGSAGTIFLQHAPVRASSAFSNLAGTSVALDAAGPDFVQITSFSRYIRWRATSVGGSPVVLIDLIAKARAQSTGDVVG